MEHFWPLIQIISVIDVYEWFDRVQYKILQLKMAFSFSEKDSETGVFLQIWGNF